MPLGHSNTKKRKHQEEEDDNSDSESEEEEAGWLAGWQPIVYSKTAARLLKAAWCLLRIATPCAVLRRLTEVAGRPAARCLHGSNLPPSHSSMSSVVTLLPFAFFLRFWPFGLNTISL